MKTDSELEALLRTTLASRATDVVDAPALPSGLPNRRRPSWLPILAAAAAVLLAVAGVFVGIKLTKDDRPAQPTPSQCQPALPAEWRSALENSPLDTNGRITHVLSIAPDGSLLAVQDDGPQPGAGRFLVQLFPNHTSDVIANIPDPDELTPAVAELYDHWLVLGLKHEPRPPKGEMPSSTPTGLAKLEVWDLQAHDVHVLMPLFNGSLGQSAFAVGSAVVFDGRVYWDQRRRFADTDGELMSYDLATGETTSVYSGPIGHPVLHGGGVAVSLGAGAFKTVVPATLPQPVAAAMTPFARNYVTTDGSAYAWLASRESPNTLVVGWWAPGQDAPLYRRLTPGELFVESGSAGMTVAGRYLVTVRPGGGAGLIDMVSGAGAILPATYDGTTRAQFFLSRGGVLAGIGIPESEGHFVNGYWQDAAITALELDTNGLPPLTC